MLEAQIRNEVAELRLLLEVTQALDGGTELRLTELSGGALAGRLQATLALLAKYTGMMRGALALRGQCQTWPGESRQSHVLNADEQDRQANQQNGQDNLAPTGKPDYAGSALIEQVLQNSKIMAVPRNAPEPVFLQTGGAALRKEEISFICVPILLQGEAIGALAVDRLFADSVSLEEDLRLLQVLARLIAKKESYRQAEPATGNSDENLSSDNGNETGSPTLAAALNRLEKQLIFESLQACSGNLAKAARQLGITERIMGLRMKKYGLDYRDFRK